MFVCLLCHVFPPSLSLPSNLQLVKSYSRACPEYHKCFVCSNFAPYENAGQVRTLSRTFVLSFSDKLETHCKECRINLMAGNRLCELLVGWLSLNSKKCCFVFFVLCAVSYCCTFQRRFVFIDIFVFSIPLCACKIHIVPQFSVHVWLCG